MPTLKQTQSEKGRVTSTMAQDTAVSTQPHSPIPLLLSSAETINSIVTLSHVRCTVNEGPVRIQCQCLVQIYVFPVMKQPGLIFPKQNYNVLSPNLHIHVSVSYLYIPRIGLPNRQRDPGNI
jgi:hypothetical protein